MRDMSNNLRNARDTEVGLERSDHHSQGLPIARPYDEAELADAMEELAKVVDATRFTACIGGRMQIENPQVVG